MLLDKSYKSKLTITVLALLIICAASAVSAKSGITLRSVDHTNVCMTNNKDMGRPQLPVEVNGKTYYGCCKMCAGNLKNNEEARYGTDPVTGKKVDKALAYLGALPNGDILYFESEENFKAFIKSN